MYWDILYNTQNDKVPYNDSFKHTSWLVMMKNRLEIAKKLLKPDGVMIVQCDKNEDAYLKVLMDEIWGRDNYINTISVKSSSLSGPKTAHKDKTILKTKDSVLIYKNGGEIRITPQYTKKEKWDTHYNHFLKKHSDGSYEDCKLKDILIENNIISFEESINEDFINNKKFMEFCLKNKDVIFRPVNSIDKKAKEDSLNKPNEIIRYYNKNGEELLALNGNRCSFLSSTVKEIDGEDTLVQLLGDLWIDIDFQNTQNEGNNSLPAGKKPEALIRRIIEMFMSEGDIILDAYLGSGTTAAVAHKMNMRYIGIEQLDSHIDKTLLRMKGVIDGEQSGISKGVNWQGGGEFIYCELANNSQNYIDKISIASDEELINIYNEISKSNFLTYKVDSDKILDVDTENEFIKLSITDKKRILINIIEKNTLYINYSEIDDKSNNISDDIKSFNYKFYTMEDDMKW
ncbi:MAG: site-specific DNA-methyltransferase [Clostridium sp.]|nr:site-specific DNA-methyltransferase [Clostridium sp.]